MASLAHEGGWSKAKEDDFFSLLGDIQDAIKNTKNKEDNLINITQFLV
jgi:hypothetical protein